MTALSLLVLIAGCDKPQGAAVMAQTPLGRALRWPKREIVLTPAAETPGGRPPAQVGKELASAAKRWNRALAGLPLPGTLGRSAFSLRAGAETPPLAVSGHPLAISICFEDILAEAVRSEVVRTNAELLVNLTSDRWFKDTSAVDFHFALAKLRAVEHGKYLVRATRDGISAVVDSSGQIVVQAERKRSSIVSAKVPLLSRLSPYSWLAPWFHAACLAGAVALLVYIAVSRAPSLDQLAGSGAATRRG